MKDSKNKQPPINHQAINHQVRQWLFLLTKGKKAKSLINGFTLIELMIVFLILGVLAVTAIPVLFGQIGKSRESETLFLIGTMARSQQAYHYVYGEFAPTLNDLENDSGPINSKYHDVDNITATGNVRVKIQAVALNPGTDQVRDYAVGVYFNNGGYERATCQGELIGSAVQVGDNASDPCTNNGVKVN